MVAGAGLLIAGILLFLATLAIVGKAPSSNVSLITALVIVLFTVLVGLPIAFALMLGTIVFLHMGGTVAMIALPQNMVDGTGRFVLLALPFFIFAGIIMERGGISRRLVSFVAAIVGGIRGGLLQVMVVSMYIVSGISGSKAADVAAVGLVMRDMLEKEKYDIDQSAALLAASAAMGECIPPSLAMLVLGSVTSLSVAALFAGGLIPAAVIALCLMALIWFASSAAFCRAPLVRRTWAVWRLGAMIPFTMPVLPVRGHPARIRDAHRGLRVRRRVRPADRRRALSRDRPARFPRHGGRGGDLVGHGAVHARRRAVVLVGAVGGRAAASARGARHDLGDRSVRSFSWCRSSR